MSSRYALSLDGSGPRATGPTGMMATMAGCPVQYLLLMWVRSGHRLIGDGRADSMYFTRDIGASTWATTAA